MTDFVFKAFEEMKPKDYEKIGFMSGLEVHQQLLTDKKLFCRCPAGKYSREYDAELLRHMRPTLSELGEYDGTALMEYKTRKDIIYRINHHSVCTYEMDDTPPFMMNDDALNIGISIGLLFKTTVVDELHIARKQYLDGSIPTGFQRTAIFCVNGKIPYKEKEITIIQVSIEEDSCRERGDVGHKRIWFTDRLGMPLIETVTAPDMKTPAEVAEVCELIRRAARSTGMVRTGHGASRQDVNVSVRGGTRAEIKGVSSIKEIPLLTYNEAMRQWNLLKLKDELKKRKITTENMQYADSDVTEPLRKTDFEPIRSCIENGGFVKSVVLKGFHGLLQWQTQTNTVFAKEISDRVRVIACLTSLPNIICFDDPEKSITSTEWNEVKTLSDNTNKDAIILVWGSKRDLKTAVEEIVIRAREAALGVPSETRQALSDGTDGFERILPGPGRMYPDTDLPPKLISGEVIKELALSVPKNYWNREKMYRKLGVPEDVIIPLTISKFSQFFEYLVNEEKVDPILSSVVIIQFMKRLKKRGKKISIIEEPILKEIFSLYNSGDLVKDGIYRALMNCIELGKFSKDGIPKPCSSKELTGIIKESEKEMASLQLYDPGNYKKLLMGVIMKKAGGRVNGSEVADIIELGKVKRKDKRVSLDKK